MKIHHSVSVIILAALSGIAIVGLILTARVPAGTEQVKAGRAAFQRARQLVDQRPLETARSLAALASTGEERQFAQDAVRVADHEVDMAFASALREASQETGRKHNGEIQRRLNKAQDQVTQYQSKLKELTAESAKAKGDRLSGLQQRIALTQAQLELAKDELADAQQDMARAGGDLYSQIQRMWQEHESAEHQNGGTRLNSTGATPGNFSSQSLIGRWQVWSALASERAQLSQAANYVLSKTAELTNRHNALEQQAQAGQGQKQNLEQQAATLLKSGKPEDKQNAGEIAAEALSTLRQLSQDEISMADLDHRIQDLRSLSTIYGRWTGLVIIHERTALHRLIRSALWIFLALLIATIAGRLMKNFFEHVTLERKQRMTLYGVVRFAIQAVATLVILLVLFGSPNHMFTVLGLAGAGLTVTLKDFVVAFCGWFVLMGRNGIRVGDWVEINGVRGEVVEIGLLRTVLLETGNWTQAGHPTGRQVAFLNSYAVEGYFFNFSTTGQWMWDELPLLIPSNEDPYPLMEKIRAVVAQETGEAARSAEEEWRHASHRFGVSAFSAEPEINANPGDSGVRLIVRYITRASERYEVRSRLSHAIVKLLRHGEVLLPPAGAAPSASGVAAPEVIPGSGRR